LGIYFFVFFQKHFSKQLSAQGKTEDRGIAATRAKVKTIPVIIERNIFRANVMVPPLDFIDQLIEENHWDYLFHCSGIVYP